MMKLAQRSLALLLALILCLSILPSGVIRAVNYETGDADTYSGVIKNWGTRGTAATYLSQNAEAFYQNNGTSYADLSALSGAENVQQVPDSALYAALQLLMASNHSVINTYADTTALFRYTDCTNSDDSAISAFYSGTSVGPEWDSGATWNREHIWPNSKGLAGDDENDIMMLRPSVSSENSSRGNKAYGESAGYFDPNAAADGSYDLRGDVARIALYVYVRWGNTENMWGTDGVIENREILLNWMEEDPVDTWELGRNDSVESITGTRNVFVDYPELAFILFGTEVPGDLTTPSGEASGSNVYSITAESDHTEYGAVYVNGNTVVAVPAEGYAVSGYTLVSGNAEITQNGNTFVVSAASDCNICIHFTARDTVTVTFTENGTAVSEQTVYSGDTIILPGYSGTLSDEYTFLGWVNESFQETAAVPVEYYAPGASYTAKETMTLYALYSRVDSESSVSGDVYYLFSGSLEEGSYIIVYDGGALQAAAGSGGRLAYSDITVTNNSIQSPAEDLVWNVALTDDGYYTLYNESGAVYAGGTGSKNKAGLLSEITDYAKWTVSGEETYDFVNLGNYNKDVNYTLRKNGVYGYACYATSTGGSLTLYKNASGTVYYSTVMAACQHIDTVQISGTEPGCTEPGYSAGMYCNDCQSYISGHETLEALGHSYDPVVTPPTVTEQGYTTYTCSVCGDSYIGDYTEPTGELYTVSFQVPEGVESVSGMECGNAGIVLPSAGVPEGDTAYVFAGWAAQTVDNSETAPTLYRAGSTYTTDSHVTLYAVYSYFVGEAGTGKWLLVTDTSLLIPGAQLVIASREKGFTAGRISSQYMTHVETVFSEDMTEITELPGDAVILTLGGSDGAWTLINADGQLLGATAVKKLAWDKGTTTWSITVADGVATILNTDSNYGSFRYNVNSPRFTTYTSAATSSMRMPQLYRKDTGVGTTYYTTVIGHTCLHDGETELRGQVDANPAADGYTGDVYCSICGELLQTGTVIPRNPFTDVKADHFEAAIVWAYYQKITYGTTDTTFSPEAQCTREQIVTMLWRAAGCPEPASWENPFTDVLQDRFEKAILWAYHAGITYGTTETTFSPDAPCTREQMVAFLWRANGSPEPSSAENPFTDVPQQDGFEKAILWAYCEGVTYGTTKTTFSPDATCTRKQCVSFLFRLLNPLEE